MRIAVLVKQVPDSWAEKRLGQDGRLVRDGIDLVLNELDEYALEEALTLAEREAATVEVVAMGPDSAADALRRALAMGADSAVWVNDAALSGADYLQTARVLAAVVNQRGYDLVFAGVETTDSRGGVIPAMLATVLKWPQLTYASSVSLQSGRVEATRHTGSADLRLAASLPAVISVVEKANVPRYPNLKGVLAAKKKPLEVLSLADLPIAAAVMQAQVQVAGHSLLPQRAKGTALVGATAENAKALVDFLRSKKVI